MAANKAGENKRARQSREPKDRVFSHELRAILNKTPKLFPRKIEFRDYLNSEFPGAGFRNSTLTEIRSGEPAQHTHLVHFLAYLRNRHAVRLDSAFAGSFSSSTLDELAARYIVAATDEETRPRSSLDILTAGPATVASELLSRGSRLEGASPIKPVDIPIAAQSLAIAVGDAYNQDNFLAPVGASAELGLEVLRLTHEGLCQMLSEWRQRCPMSVMFKRHENPEKCLLSMAMPLSETIYSEFIAGTRDEFSIVHGERINRSNRVLLLTASGDARSSRQGKLELMIMVLNQLSQIMSPLTQSETRIACAIHPGVLGKRAEQWGFRTTGAVIPRLGPTNGSNCFPPTVEAGELVLPSTPLPSRNAVLWGLLFLWQCFYTRESALFKQV